MGKSRSVGNLASENLIYVDIASDRVGIGTTVPSSILDVYGPISINGSEIIDGSGVWQGPTAGLQGIQGTTGSQGTSGVIGVDGSQGVQGTTGSQGAIGVQGTIGVQGSTGITIGTRTISYQTNAVGEGIPVLLRTGIATANF